MNEPLDFMKMDIGELSELIEDDYEEQMMTGTETMSEFLKKAIIAFYNRKAEHGAGPYGCFGHYWTDATKTKMLSGTQVLAIIMRTTPKGGGTRRYGDE